MLQYNDISCCRLQLLVDIYGGVNCLTCPIKLDIFDNRLHHIIAVFQYFRSIQYSIILHVRVLVSSECRSSISRTRVV